MNENIIQGKDVTKLHNPYDFANPVSDRSLFSGRATELDDINYYLDQAKSAPRAINLALMGERASGKTSLLNMIELEAKSRSFCTVRIDLNEGDVETQMSFFYKVFDCIFTAICKTEIKDADSGSYYFEGRFGNTYQTYLDLTSSYSIPDDKTFCPFIFPIQYAKAMSNNSTNSKVSDAILKNDLEEIRSRVGCTIVILFDECNVLTKNRVLLEMLRNIFMNLHGYMLVFTGTEELFPIMDEIFSPIIRQFKKIEVKSFESSKETEECIGKPLKKIGIEDWRRVFSRSTLNELTQIHDLTGGRPYEIQLLCHFMFKRLQLGKSRKMELNLEVLDDVLNELKTGHDILSRPIIAKVRDLDSEHLKALNLFTETNGRVTFQQIWANEYIFKGESKYKEQDLKSFFDRFIADQILIEKDGVVRFGGDEFDKIYVKYYAQQNKRVRLNFFERSFDEQFSRSLSRFFQLKARLTPINEIFERELITDTVFQEALDRGVAIALESAELYQLSVFDYVAKIQEISEQCDVYSTYPEASSAFYWMMVNNNFKKNDSVELHNIYVESNSKTTNYGFLKKNNSLDESREFIISLTEIIERAKTSGLKIVYEAKSIDVIPIKTLVHNLNCSGNSSLRQKIKEDHESAIVQNYLSDPKNLDQVKYHLQISELLDSTTNSDMLNNYGYIYLGIGDYKRSKEFLEMAIENPAAPGYEALSYYNLGILYLKQDNFEDARNSFMKVISAYELNPKSILNSVIEYVPYIKEGSIEFEEKDNVPLLGIAKDSLDFIEQFLALKK